MKPIGIDLARRKLRVAAPVTRKLAIVATVCLAAAAALLAGPGARAAVVLPAPAITVADGNSVIATATDTFGLNFYWNQYGTGTWHTEQVTTSQKIAESALGRASRKRRGDSGPRGGQQPVGLLAGQRDQRVEPGAGERAQHDLLRARDRRRRLRRDHDRGGTGQQPRLLLGAERHLGDAGPPPPGWEK